jgi:protochlorophyllide reductase
MRRLQVRETSRFLVLDTAVSASLERNRYAMSPPVAFVAGLPVVTRTVAIPAVSSLSALRVSAFSPSSARLLPTNPSTQATAPARSASPPTMALARTVIVTGASSSIGLYAAKSLIDRGDTHVVMAVRDVAKGAAEAARLGFPTGSYTVLPLDLASFKSVRAFSALYKAKGFRALNGLVCNAAIWYPKDKRTRVTEDGFDETVQVNHLSHFLLSNLLLPDLKAAQGRLVFLATQTHNPDTLPGKIPPQADLGDLAGIESGFKGFPGTIDGGKFEPTKAYKDSKVCNVLTMTEMDKRHGADGVIVSAIFPGCIAESNLFREKRGWFRALFPLFQKFITKQYVSVEEAGRRVACVASDPEFGDSGKYWQWRGSYLQGADKTTPVSIMPTEREIEKADRLWDVSEKLVGLKTRVPV